MREEQVYVRLDNSLYINFPSDFPAKEAYWCVARPRRVAQKTVLTSRFIDNMKPQGLLLIVSSLLASLQDHSLGVLLSPNAVKGLRSYAKRLAIECGSVDAPPSPQTPTDPPRSAVNEI
jgi:hypothetical protein